MKRLSVSGKRIRGHVIVTLDVGRTCVCGRELLLTIKDGKVEEKCTGGDLCKKT